MREKALDHMASLPAPLFPHFLKHLALCFVLIAASSCVYALSSAFSTILAMVLPISVFFALYKRRELQEPNRAATPQATGRAAFKGKIEESGTSKLYESSVNDVAGVLSSPSKPAASGDESEVIFPYSGNQIQACPDSSISDDESADHLTASSDGPASDEESSVEDLDRTRTPSETDTSSDSSISDEEGLIEIALQDGHPLVAEGAKNTALRRGSQGYPSVFSPPEMVLRQQWLPEPFAEMNEEENLIEIDIAVGSVKCSRLEIKA